MQKVMKKIKGKKKKNIEFKKTLTREVPLVAISSIYDGMVNLTSKFFQTKFAENFYIFRKGTVEYYQDMKRFMRDVPIAISKKIKSRKINLRTSFKSLQKQFDIIKKAREGNNRSSSEIYKNLRKILEAFAVGHVGLTAVFWIPRWQEFLSGEGITIANQNLIDEAK